MLVGVGALAVVVALLVGYVLGGAAVHSAGRAAQERADCATAVDRFDLVDGLFELTLSPAVLAARQGRVECVDFTAAVAQQERGAWPDAVSALRALRTTYPTSPLQPAVQQRLLDTLDRWADSLRAADDPTAAIAVYRDLLGELPPGGDRDQVRAALAETYLEQAAGLRAALAQGPRSADAARAAFDALLIVPREFGDTPAAAAVPQALTETYTAAVADLPAGEFCAALPALSELVELSDPDTGGLGSRARTDRSGALLECGLGQLRAGQNGQAVPNLQTVVSEHADSPQLAQARSALISAQVGVAKGGAVPVPAPLGGDAPGGITITYYNDSPYERLVRVVGATAHEFVLPPCPQCPAEYPDVASSCPTFDGRPAKELRLGPGEYTVYSSTDDAVAPLIAVDLLEPGFVYTDCLFVQTRPPG